MGSFPPPSIFPLPIQVGIQVTSEDLCSEKQWSVCKALATFVAHRELSKVGGCPGTSVLPVTIGQTSNPQSPRRAHWDPTYVLSFPCTSHGRRILQTCLVSCSLGLCPRGRSGGGIWRLNMMNQVKVKEEGWHEQGRAQSSQSLVGTGLRHEVGLGDRPLCYFRNLVLSSPTCSLTNR
jgi:hypothetical protein